MSILVTGGAGFIGSNLCKRLVKSGKKVICLDNFYTSEKSNIKKLMDFNNFQFIERDIIEPIELNDIDEIYHLASPASPPQYQKNPVFTIRTNFIGTENCLKLALSNNAKFLLASTSEVYGDPIQHPQKETYWGNVNPIGVRSCYDEGKRISETLTMDYYRQYKIDTKIIRIFNTYGPNMEINDGRVVSNFITQALKDENITIYGDGSQTRSFQFVDDLVSGIVKTMDKQAFRGPVNLGNPNEFTIQELAEFVLQAIPESKSKIIYKDLPSDDPKKRKPDISLAKKELGWEPKIQLKEGLLLTVKYFREVIKNSNFK